MIRFPSFNAPRRTLLLVSMLILQVSVLAGLCATPTVLEWTGWTPTPSEAPMVKLVRWRRALYQSDQDPKRGIPAPSVRLRNKEGGTVTLDAFQGHRVALIFGYDVSSCSAKQVIEAWSRFQEQHSRDIVIFAVERIDKDAKAAIAECAKGPVTVRILLDPAGKTAKRFNAKWLLRAYTVDQSGRLAYIQPESTVDRDAPGEVNKLWGGTAISMAAPSPASQ